MDKEYRLSADELFHPKQLLELEDAMKEDLETRRYIAHNAKRNITSFLKKIRHQSLSILLRSWLMH